METSSWFRVGTNTGKILTYFGNLTLTGYNSEYKDKFFTDKKE